MQAADYHCMLSLTHFSRPSSLSVSSCHPLKASAELAKGRSNQNKRNSEERGRRGRQKKKEGRVFRFCSHHSSLAGRYPGRQCLWAEVWQEGYQWVRWGASATFLHIAHSQNVGGGGGRALWRGKGDYSLAPVCCKSALPHRVCWGMREQCCRT